LAQNNGGAKEGRAMTNEEVVRNACQVIWSEGQVDRVAEFYHEDFTSDYPMTNWGEGLAGIKNLATEVRVGMPDYREHIDLLIDGGDSIVVQLTIKGTHTGPMSGLPPTGKAVEFRDMTICRVKDGKIIEQRGLSDLLTLYYQLGMVQLPTAGEAVS
jgi:predicted ester cyclase